jgi:hypothetical protein
VRTPAAGPKAPHWAPAHDREAAREADNAAWLRLNESHAELDLLAPGAVRDAVAAADEALEQVGATLVIHGVPTHPDPIGAATEACRASLDPCAPTSASCR